MLAAEQIRERAEEMGHALVEPASRLPGAPCRRGEQRPGRSRIEPENALDDDLAHRTVRLDERESRRLIVGIGRAKQLEQAILAFEVDEVRAGLTHLGVLSFPTLPGGAVPGDFPTCYNDLRREFVRDPGRPLDTQACGHQSPRINFVVPTT